MIYIKLDDNIEQINSIGIQRATKLHKLGIYKIEDIIEYFPRSYNDRTNILYIDSLKFDEENTFIATIAVSPENVCINNKIITKVKLRDSTGTITAIWYNQSYMKNNFRTGEEYIFTGKVLKKYNKLEIYSPEYEKIGIKELLSGGRIVPIYPSTYKFSQKMIRQLIKGVLDTLYNDLDDFIPLWIKNKYSLSDRNFAIKNIHFPTNDESFFKARYRLVFEEFFLLQIGLSRIKMLTYNTKQGLIIKKYFNEKQLFDLLPFKLTNAQKKALNEIKYDFSSGHIMNRLVQGDVGSGKTIIAILAAFIIAVNGYQTAMMVPTEVLASQHYESFNSYLCNKGIKTVVLTGSMTKKHKLDIYSQIKNGEADIILGTHSLIQENVIFKNLGFVITDEQHRFGVRQRTLLSNKGSNPHILVMTATPIPRTLALILYGDLDITIIDELPPGRQTIDTYCVNSSYRDRIYSFIKKEILKGRQAYIVCPMVEETDKKELQSVKQYTEKLKSEAFMDYNVCYIYGKMKSNEKQSIMDKYISGEINILVSTTVIEVGINVPNATIILIENSERFGLAQLHQLRGRVGRGVNKSYCILMTDSKNKITSERMKIMTKSSNGFELSEVDLNLRGPGDFFGTKQHGLPEMKIANLYEDINVLKLAQEASTKFLECDFNIEKNEHLPLKLKIQKFFNNNHNISL